MATDYWSYCNCNIHYLHTQEKYKLINDAVIKQNSKNPIVRAFIEGRELKEDEDER